MIIVETCPRCGHDLRSMSICTNPPIPAKECPSCGWYWEGEPEQVIRVPFGGNQFGWPSEQRTGFPSACASCPNHPSNGGSGICNCILGSQTQVYC